MLASMNTIMTFNKNNNMILSRRNYYLYRPKIFHRWLIPSIIPQSRCYRDESEEQSSGADSYQLPYTTLTSRKYKLQSCSLRKQRNKIRKSYNSSK